MKNHSTIPQAEDVLFTSISNDISEKGYSIQRDAFPMALAELLLQQVSCMTFKKAGVGRKQNHKMINIVRNNEISWIDDSTTAGKQWFLWTAALQSFLNKSLFLGLFSMESHFARYSPGDFYKKHSDAFKGEANRKLSLVLYLNKNWNSEDEGELVLYDGDNEIKVEPQMGTLIIFLSENFPHEVRETQCDRFSIAGWYSVNTLKL